MLRVPIMRIVDGKYEAFTLTDCTDISVNISNSFKRMTLDYSIDTTNGNVLLVRVEGDQLALGVYSLEVKGKLKGNDWRSNELCVFKVVDDNDSADTGVNDGSYEIETMMPVFSHNDLDKLATKEDVKNAVKGQKKKVPYKIVCRKAIKLGATAQNGNLVKYFTHQPMLKLESYVPYRIYKNGEPFQILDKSGWRRLGFSTLSFYTAVNILENDVFEIYDTRFKKEDLVLNHNSFCVSIILEGNGVDNIAPLLVWVDCVKVDENGVNNIYLKVCAADHFSYNTGNFRYTIQNSRVVGILRDFDNLSEVGDLNNCLYKGIFRIKVYKWQRDTKRTGLDTDNPHKVVNKYYHYALKKRYYGNDDSHYPFMNIECKGGGNL